MRILARLAFLSLLPVTILLGQANPKRIFLSPKSIITTAEIAEGFAKYCPNVAITQDAGKADYVLEVTETVSADKGTTDTLWRIRPTHERGTWDFVLLAHPHVRGHKYKHRFAAVCRLVNKLVSPPSK
jgi:hypothetical protein